jgi:hypothetical protein
MSADEYAAWRAKNSVVNTYHRAGRPCEDCLFAFALDMRARGRCNGTPAGADAGEDTMVDIPAISPLNLERGVRIAAMKAERHNWAVIADALSTSIGGAQQSWLAYRRWRDAKAENDPEPAPQAAGAEEPASPPASAAEEPIAAAAPAEEPEDGRWARAAIPEAVDALGSELYPNIEMAPGHDLDELVGLVNSATRATVATMGLPDLLAVSGPDCEACIHGVVCGLRAYLIDGIAAREPILPAGLTVRVAIDCAHFRAEIGTAAA